MYLQNLNRPNYVIRGAQEDFFMFHEKPTSSIASYVTPIYHGFCTGYDAFSSEPYSVGTSYCGHTDCWNAYIKGYIFRTQRPGTQPIYRVMESRYENEKMVYKYEYVTRLNAVSKRNVTSWVWNWLGTRKLRDKNWTEVKNYGVVGYAYVPD